MRRIISQVILSLTLLLILTSCYDSKEVTEWSYVLGIGLEKGVTDKLRMTVQLATMKTPQGTGGSEMGNGNGSGGGEDTEIQEKSGYLTISLDCPTFYAGVNMINSYLSREINYMHTKYIIFSQSLAKEGIDTYITALVRGRQMRRNMNVIISKESPSKFIKEYMPVVGTLLSRTQQNMINLGKDTGLFPQARYGLMINDLKSLYTQPIAILADVNYFKKYSDEKKDDDISFKTAGKNYAGDLVRKGGSKIEFFGTAVFDGGKMVGELNGDETRALLMARGDFKRGFFVIEDPKKPDTTVTMDIRDGRKPRIKVRLGEDNAIINLTVFLEGDIKSIQSTIDYENKEFKSLLEEEYTKHLENKLEQTIEKCQELNVDVFKFGHYVAKEFSTIQEWEKYYWLKHFKDAQINVQVKFIIRRTGTMLRSSEFFSSEGKKGDESE